MNTFKEIPGPWQQDEHRHKVKNVFCGFCYTIVQTEDGSLFGCGNNFDGQLGLGPDADNIYYTFQVLLLLYF